MCQAGVGRCRLNIGVGFACGQGRWRALTGAAWRVAPAAPHVCRRSKKSCQLSEIAWLSLLCVHPFTPPLLHTNAPAIRLHKMMSCPRGLLQPQCRLPAPPAHHHHHHHRHHRHHHQQLRPPAAAPAAAPAWRRRRDDSWLAAAQQHARQQQRCAAAAPETLEVEAEQQDEVQQQQQGDSAQPSVEFVGVMRDMQTVRGVLATHAPPELVYAILTDYDSCARVFRNICGSQTLFSEGGGKQVVQVRRLTARVWLSRCVRVVPMLPPSLCFIPLLLLLMPAHPLTHSQACTWQFLAFRGTFNVALHVTEDAAQRLLVFTLAESTFMRDFEGRWRVSLGGGWVGGLQGRGVASWP